MTNSGENPKTCKSKLNMLKTEKGRAILSAAMRGFLKHGYHGYSMAALGAQVSLSKGSLYHYIDDKADLAFAAVEALKLRFHEISYGPEKKDLYGLKDGEMVVLLPLVLLEAGILAIKLAVIEYFKQWYWHFLACGDRRDDSFKNFDETSNHYAFWAWVGFWCMTHTGALPVFSFDKLRGKGESGNVR